MKKLLIFIFCIFLFSNLTDAGVLDINVKPLTNGRPTPNTQFNYSISLSDNNDCANTPNTVNITSTCYQETANISTSCGGLSTGTYFIGPNWVNIISPDRKPLNLYDGNWSTRDYGDWLAPEAYFYINYSKPLNSLSNSLWQVKFGDLSSPWVVNISNFTIPSVCWNQVPLQFRLVSNNSCALCEHIRGDCYNGTSWSSIFYQNQSDGYPSIYEEAIYWNISSTSSNSVAVTTDKYGIGNLKYDLGNTNSANYICEYRNGVLRKVHNATSILASYLVYNKSSSYYMNFTYSNELGNLTVKNSIIGTSNFTITRTLNVSKPFRGNGSMITNIGGGYPIGTIMPWMKSFGGTPQNLPIGWQEANGLNVTDSASPYNGKATPNLSLGYILRGSVNGNVTTGGNTLHSHIWTRTGTNTPTYDSAGNAVAPDHGSGDSASADPIHWTQSADRYTSKPAGNSLPSYYEMTYIMKIK